MGPEAAHGSHSGEPEICFLSMTTSLCILAKTQNLLSTFCFSFLLVCVYLNFYYSHTMPTYHHRIKKLLYLSHDSKTVSITAL